MTRGKYSLTKRIIAFALSMVLVFSVLPAMSVKADSAATTEGILSSLTVVDPATLDSWKQTAFNPTNLTTEHAGGIWTDKSVLTHSAAFSANSPLSGLGITMDEDSFLVVLSALAANSVVSGSGTTPSDTVFVLDISGSMSGADLRSMVSATNDAIHTLLTANDHNRVGVIVYASSATELLPLDRYTPVTEEDNAGDEFAEYIEYSGSTIRAGRKGQSSGGGGRPGSNQNYTYITNSAGRQVTTSVSTGGGTYIQGGLWAAWETFEETAVTDSRAPVLVLMSDGAPTFVTNDFGNVPDSYEGGDGNNSGEGEGFLTQLTAAYVKAKMAEKYSVSASYMYTVGLGLTASNSTTTTDNVAEAVLNTDKTHSDIADLWNTYVALGSAGTKTMSVPVYYEAWMDSGITNTTVTYDATVSSKNQMAYADKYFSAADASGLSAAFKGIVNEINLRASYNVTRVTGTDLNTDGYVTFVDEIASGMEVKGIKGILIGNTLFTGEKLAKALIEGAFGTATEPTTLGDNMVWALKKRLGITDTAVVHDLIQKAYDAGQIAYNAATGEFSNEIGWFADANGNYLGFWDYGDPNAVIPAGAAYANACYGMLGTTTHDQTAHASDMMYVAVQVSKPVTNGVILANSPQTVTFRVPASLLPTVTYQIHVELDGNENIIADSATISYNAAEPIRLVYEVGVHSDVTPENIKDFLRPGYQAKDANGNYYLYSNAWNWTPSSGEADFNNPPSKDGNLSYVLEDTALNAITYAYFEPGEDNEHYYFAADSLVYSDKNGTLYNGNAQPNGKYYYRHTIYTATDTGATGNEVKATITYQYEELTDYALGETRQNADGTWYVPEGTMRHATHSHDLSKTENVTGSFYDVRHQMVNIPVEGDASHHYELIYLGNNGRITYSPAQGFALTKKLAAGATASGERFTFTVTVNGDTDGKVKVNGAETALTGGKLTLKLRADETVTVTGLNVGVTYTVEEEELQGWKLVAAAGAVVDGNTVRGIVAENAIHEIVFTNDVQVYGGLLVTKTVTYNKGATAPATLPEFQVSVTLDGMAGKTVYVGVDAVTVDEDDKVSFTIKDGQFVNITGIPAGTNYVVEEVLEAGTTNIPAGFAPNSGYTAESYRQEGVITDGAAAVAALHNVYTPNDVVLNNVEPAVTLDVTKTVVGASTGDFAFQLLEYDAADHEWKQVTLNGANVTANITGNGTAQLDLAGLTFDSAGSHYFRVAEVIPNPIPDGWTYDRTFHDFEIVVADNGEGQLVINEVKTVQHAEVTPDASADRWNVATQFTNTYAVQSTKLTIEGFKKLLNGRTGAEMELQDGQFEFALYLADSSWNTYGLDPIDIEKNGVAGDIIFATITYDTAGDYYYVVKETSLSGNGITVDSAEYQIWVKVEMGTGGLEVTGVTVQGNPVALSADNVLDRNAIAFENTYMIANVAQGFTGNKTLTDMTPGAAGTMLDVKTNTFSFTMEPITVGAPLPYRTTVFAGADGSIDWGRIAFNDPGTYQYKVTEDARAAAGVTNDTAVYVVTVVVEDTGKGALRVASVTYTKDGVPADKIIFNNTYKAVPPNDPDGDGFTEIVLNGGKVLKVDEDKFTRSLKTGEFRFILKDADGKVIETVTNNASGNFAFSALKFDSLGEYTYTITEEHAGEVRDGVIYSSETYTVTITVTDTVKDGVMEVAVAYSKDGEAAQDIQFTNEYKASAVSVDLTAQKYLNGNLELKPGDFSFTLTPVSANAQALSNAETKANGENGLVSFSTITYDGKGEYVYTIVENKLDENGKPIEPNADGLIIYKGVTYSQRVYTVTVTVTDNGNGQLQSAIATVDDHGNELPVQFFNSYKAAPVTVDIEGDTAHTAGKTLEDLSSQIDKTLKDFEFQFMLMDENGNVLQTVTENDAGFAFDDITYDQAGTYIYYVCEIPGGNAAVSYDEAKYRITVTIEDDKEGQLFVKALTYEKAESGESDQYDKVDSITFKNTYQAKKTSVNIAGLKSMEGGYKLKGDDFSFILRDENGNEIETVQNDKEGLFTFKTIEYLEEGKYVYTLEEVAGDNKLIAYDGAKFVITVTVTDVDGELTKQVEIVKIKGEDKETVDAYGFTNVYTPEDVTTAITVQKILDNKSDKTMGLDGFTFQLELEDQKTLLTSEASGKVAFELTFTAQDIGKTYTYKLSEVAGDVDGMTYSDKVYEINVAVTQNDDGELVLTITREGTGDFTFTNTYAPKVAEDEPPKLGVDVNVTGWTLMMSVSAICLLAVLVLGKKKLLEE